MLPVLGILIQPKPGYMALLLKIIVGLAELEILLNTFYYRLKNEIGRGKKVRSIQVCKGSSRRNTSFYNCHIRVLGEA